MSKQIFRFLRGELLSGFYIKNIQNLMNNYTESIKKFFVTFNKQQFKQGNLTIETVYNLGKFAGVFLPVIGSGEGYGALFMSESNIVNGKERSERGLLKRSSETFAFEHTDKDSYSEDINTLADIDKRSSLAGDDGIQGYLDSSNSKILRGDGTLDKAQIVYTKPTGVAYSDFYGDKFLYLSEKIITTKSISSELYIPLFKVMQYIRYNGESIKSLCQIINILCPNGFVTISNIEKMSIPCFKVAYQVHNEVALDNKIQRINTLNFVVSQKFHQFIMEEAI